MEDVVEGGLRRAAQRVGGAQRVEPVLQDVVIGGRERDRAELVAELVDLVELVGVVGRRALPQQLRRLVQRPAVEVVHFSTGTASRAGSKSKRLESWKRKVLRNRR